MKRYSPVISIVLAALIMLAASAQVNYEDGTYTSYSIVNLGTEDATIQVTYYDENGNPQDYAPSFPSVPQYGSVTVQQALESSLAPGNYSAVVSSNQPIAAIANQQLGKTGSGTSISPFSSYSGFSDSEGATEIILPSIMYNWYGYYTEIYIQNVGSVPASNVTISYSPTSIGSCTTGATSQVDSAASIGTIAPYATKRVSQFSKSNLGAPSVGGCGGYAGRFLGAATVRSDQPVVVVVNEIVENKLFTYNGFTNPGTDLLAPAYMRNWYGYYASLTIANPNTTNASTVELTYTNSNNGVVTKAEHTIPTGKSITIYDGANSTPEQSDIDHLYPYGTNQRFFGSVRIQSTNNVPVVAMVNQEATATAGNQAGTYNAMIASEGTKRIAVPLIQSAFWGYYTSLTIMTVDGGEATVNITYTSDPANSSKDGTKTYTYTTQNGFLNRYEGFNSTPDQSDILDDPFWLANGQRRFLGSAIIEVVSGSDIIAYVNSESSTAPYADARDTLYTYNAIGLAP